MSDATQRSVLIGHDGGTLIIKPLRPCSAALADTVRAFLRGNPDTATTNVYFDLSQTDYMDSTFAGLLVSLAGQRSGANNVAVHLARPCEDILNALKNMHLVGLFDVCDGVPSTPSEWQPLDDSPSDAERLCDLIVESHKSLVDADERNQPTFGPVIETFEAERNRRRENNPRS